MIGQLAAQEWHQAPTLKDMGFIGGCFGASAKFDKSRGQINRFDQSLADGSSGSIALWARIANDQWHPERTIVKKAFLSQIMVTEIVTMITGQDDHGCLDLPTLP